MTENEREHLSDDDQFRLELLADGELDEESRRELLVRLDRTADGWRRCALAFLEAQCLSESLKKGYPAADAPCEQLFGEVPFAAAPLASPSVQTFAERKRGTSRRTVALLSSACALLLVGFTGLNFYFGRDRQADSRPAAGRAAPAEAAAPSSGADLFLAEDTEPTEVASTDLYGNGEKAYSPKATEIAAVSGAVPARSVGTVPVAAMRAKAAAAPETGDKVQHITIRRPGGLNEISVPCVEAESYVSDNSAAEALADNYRAAGCQVETLHEELQFRLKNGKTVIVPVDTIDVQRAPQQPLHFL